uniref:Uncharacterized protein n=1 Tax=Aegilops tauschii TaxID=37682 RepID=M8BSN2_AEGTA
MGSGSTTVRLMAFASALVLLTHCIHAAAAPSFQQKQAAAKTWCVAKPSTGEAALRANLEFACSESDCSAIQGTGGCSAHNGGVLLSRASVAMNAYYQARGRNTWNCFFNATGIISITDPIVCSFIKQHFNPLQFQFCERNKIYNTSAVNPLYHDKKCEIQKCYQQLQVVSEAPIPQLRSLPANFKFT